VNPIEEKQKIHHEKFYHDILNRGEGAYDGFINPQSVWHWMHVYCMDWVKEFFQGIPKSTFLTVGDGYCGREAGYIKKYGHYVHASDYETCLIEVAKSKGLVDDFSKQDLNELEFEDQAFDYVFTKETLHHLPNPYAGLYEMFRVAERGVILIEPNGDCAAKYQCDTFEPTGNFLFMFSSDELMKVGAAYGFKYFVFTYSIVFYGPHNEAAIKEDRVEEEKGRLIAMDNGTKLIHKPLLIFFFLRNREDYNVFNTPNKFTKVEINK
jgi:SAM-dependent methyltransferase